MLAAEASLEGFLEQDPVSGPAQAPAEPRRVSGEAELAHYRLLRPLGSGGMGDVYLAQDTRLLRQVALKLLDPKLAADPRWRARFLREARLASSLDHPAICTIHEVGEADGQPYFAMQYVQGQPLSSLIEGRALPLPRLCTIASQVASAVAAAHAQGVVHRDIKGANVMVSEGDRAVVLDFGIARHCSGPGMLDVALTEPGAVLGTPASMAPEQAAGGSADPRSDLFSFGVLLYEMATGQRPFQGESRRELMTAVQTRPHGSAHALNPELPARLVELLDRLLEKSAQARPTNMRSVVEALRQVAAEAGISSRDEVAGSARETWGLARSKWLPVAAGAVLLVAVAVLWPGRPPPVATPSQLHSLAVLPFQALVPGEDDLPLQLGMADTLISRLSGLPQLAVTPLSAVERYTAGADAQKAGRQLGVDAVIDGRIQSEAGQVGMSVRLVRVADGSVVWADRFRGERGDLFALQEILSERIVAALSLQLTGSQRKRLGRHPTEDAEAYRLYTMGRFHLTRRTREGVARSADSFAQAVARDPGYALAWSGLAAARVVAAYWGYLPAAQAYPEAREAATRALAIDPELAEAHVVLASIRHYQDWDWAGAAAAWRRALELDPQLASAHGSYGLHLAVMGRHDESIEALRRALELDPLSVGRNLTYGGVLLYARRFDEALAQYRRVIEMDPEYAAAWLESGDALMMLGRHDEALDAWLEGLRLQGTDEAELQELRKAYAHAGLRGFWAALAAHAPAQTPTLLLAEFHAGAGDLETALALLETAYQAREVGMDTLGVNLKLDPLRSDPRFVAMLKRLGLAHR
ncbi:hypothetical protein BH23PSE2_BH23PSE2_02460 [soil metagenome]